MNRPPSMGFFPREWAIILLGAIGVAFLYKAFSVDFLWLRIFIVSYSLGFLYETSMDPLFTYHKELRQAHCIENTDLNLLLPLGWIFILGTCTWSACEFSPDRLLAGYVVCSLIIGNVAEMLFFKTGFWVYNYDAKYLGLFRPFRPKVTFFGIPVQVCLGYSIVGLMAYAIVHLLF